MAANSGSGSNPYLTKLLNVSALAAVALKIV